MSATIRWNRLIITANSDQEFAVAIDDFFPRLLELEYDDIECDLTGVTAPGDEGRQALASALTQLGHVEKTLVLRVPKSLEPFVKKSGISTISNLRVEVAKTIGATPATPRPKAINPDENRHEITERATNSPAAKTNKEAKPDKKKPMSSLGGAQVPLPTIISDKDMNRRTLVGLPVNVFDNESEPPTRRDDDGIEELIVGGSNLSNDADLDDIPDDLDFRQRNPGNVPELDVAWVRDEESGTVKEVRDDMTVGRAAPADWVVDAATISKRHLRIFCRNRRFYLQDMNATNGTFLNKRQVKGAPVLLVDRDLITVAHTLKTPHGVRTFTFHAKKPS